MNDLSSLPNIGKELTRQLIQAGIGTPDELRAAGAREAWMRIFAFDASACINRLYALEGAVRGISDKELTADIKAELKAFYYQAKGKPQKK